MYLSPSDTYRIKGITLKSTGKERLSPGMAFLVGAASKSLATVVCALVESNLGCLLNPKHAFVLKLYERSRIPT